MKLNDFYKSILTLGGLSCDDEGRVNIVMGSGATPMTIEGKRLVLPTKTWLSKDPTAEIVIFHPLKENLMLNAEPVIMSRFRKAINLRLNRSIGVLIRGILHLAASPALQTKLPPEQLDLLKVIKDANKKTLEEFSKLHDAMPIDSSDKNFVSIYMKSKANLNNKVHRRAVIVTWPLYEELCKEEDKQVFGVSLSKKNKATIKALLEHMFPDIAVENSYSQPGTSDRAPSLDALLKTCYKIDQLINEYVIGLSEVVDELDGLQVDGEWAEALDNFEIFASELRLTPAQNEEPEKKEEQPQQLKNWSPTASVPKPETAQVSDNRRGVRQVSPDDWNKLSRGQQQQSPQTNNGWGQQQQPAGWATQSPLGWGQQGQQPVHHDAATAARQRGPQWLNNTGGWGNSGGNGWGQGGGNNSGWRI